MTQELHILVSGLVQGVSYRINATDKATQLGLVGWVRNLPDGRVEMLAQGEEEALQALLLWAHQGPPSARVESVEVRRKAGGEISRDVFSTFQIRG